MIGQPIKGQASPKWCKQSSTSIGLMPRIDSSSRLVVVLGHSYNWTQEQRVRMSPQLSTSKIVTLLPRFPIFLPDDIDTRLTDRDSVSLVCQTVSTKWKVQLVFLSHFFKFFSQWQVRRERNMCDTDKQTWDSNTKQPLKEHLSNQKNWFWPCRHNLPRLEDDILNFYGCGDRGLVTGWGSLRKINWNTLVNFV